MYRLQTMGKLAIMRNGIGEPVIADQKPLLLVAYLALTPGHRARREHVADLFWPGNGHSSSRRSLRQAIYTLSNRTGETLVESDGTDLWLSERISACDAWELDEAVAASDHQRVFELSSRPFLENMSRHLGREVQEWIDVHNERLRKVRRESIARLIQDAVGGGRLDEAEWYARAWILDEPLAEEPRSALVRALKAAGDEAGAYRAYEEYRTLLRSAVDDEPSAELAASVENVRDLLLDEEEWRPISEGAEQLLTRRAARKYASAILVGGILLGAGAILAGVLTVAGVWSERDPVEPRGSGAVFGAGQLVVTTPDARQVLRPGATANEWEMVEPSGWPEPRHELIGPYRTTTGELVWTDRTRPLEDPPNPLVPLGGDWVPIRIGEGDVGRAIPAPDGQSYLVTAQRSDTYAKDLFIVPAGFVEGDADSDPQRILRAPSQIGAQAWAPDGLAIAAVLRGATDRIVFVRPSGEIMLERAFRDVLELDWCGGSRHLSAMVRDERGTRIVHVEVASGRVETLVEDPLGELLACSPDGTGVAFLEAINLEPRLRVHALERGEVVTVPIDPIAPSSRASWVPDALSLTPRDLSINGSDGELKWGASVRLRAIPVGVAPDASLAGEVAWSSTDPWVASVSEEGILFANRGGTARITANLHGWVADTLEVTVTGEFPSTLALQDPLASLNSERWVPFGTPSPVPYASVDGPALWLRGDGRQQDGIVSRDTYAFSAGARLEFEFAFAPERAQGERLQACLLDAVTLPQPNQSSPGQGREWICFRYPARELAKFDPERARLVTASGVDEELSLRSPLRGEWSRVALGVQPDGVPTVHVDGELVASGRLRVHGLSNPTWRVSIVGHSTEPPLLIRNVALWIGPR